MVEELEYQNGVRYGEPNSNAGRRNEADEEQKKLNRLKTQRKARSTIRRLINSNAWMYYDERGSPIIPKFITLTFAEEIRDIKQANYEFKKFRQRLEWQTGIKLKYCVVIEFQDKNREGVIHYHMITFNLPYVKTEQLEAIWRRGFVKINAIDHVDNIGAYMTKYMGKEIDDNRLVGQKCYFSSRGLKKPIEITDEKKIEQMRLALSGCKVYEAQFESEHAGLITYSQYNLLRKIIPRKEEK